MSQEKLSLHLQTHQHHSKDLDTDFQCSFTVPSLASRKFAKFSKNFFALTAETEQINYKQSYASLQNHAMLWASHASKLLGTWQAQAQWVASIFLNKDKQTDFANPWIAFQGRQPPWLISIEVINSSKM